MINWKRRLSLCCFLFVVNFVYTSSVAGLDLLPVNYFLAALFETFIVLSLLRFGSSKVVTNVQIICMILVFVHGYGFIMYMFYQEPFTYDQMQIVPNIAQFAILLWISKHDDDNHMGNGTHWNNWLRDACSHMLGSHRKEQSK